MIHGVQLLPNCNANCSVGPDVGPVSTHSARNARWEIPQKDPKNARMVSCTVCSAADSAVFRLSMDALTAYFTILKFSEMESQDGRMLPRMSNSSEGKSGMPWSLKSARRNPKRPSIHTSRDDWIS